MNIHRWSLCLLSAKIPLLKRSQNPSIRYALSFVASTIASERKKLTLVG